MGGLKVPGRNNRRRTKGSPNMGAFSRSYLQDRSSVPFPSEVIGATENLRLSLISDQPGIVEFMGSPNVVISLHVGPSVAVDCRRGAAKHRGTTIHGDLEIIPPNLGGTWEIKSRDTALVIGLKLRPSALRARVRGGCKQAASPQSLSGPRSANRARRLGAESGDGERVSFGPRLYGRARNRSRRKNCEESQFACSPCSWHQSRDARTQVEKRLELYRRQPRARSGPERDRRRRRVECFPF